MRRAARKDLSHPEIVSALRDMGATVVALDGTNVPDLLVGWRGRTVLLEVKSVSLDQKKDGYTRRRVGQLRPGQKAFQERWSGGPLCVVHDVAEAVRAVTGGGA